MWDQHSLQQLATAVDSYDTAGAEQLCADLLDLLATQQQTLAFADAVAVLRALRRKRRFGLLRRTANALLESGQRAAVVRRQYAQALIEQGELGAALDVLDRLLTECADEAGEVAEAHGLIGRAHKQRYVAGAAGALTPARQRALELAVQSYRAGYQMDRANNTWQAVNMVGLIKRAARDRATLAIDDDADAVARDVLALHQKRWDEARATIQSFDLATAAEACWALEQRDQAWVWYRRYLADAAGADAFEIASTLRQLREVWQLRDDGGGPGGAGAGDGELLAVLSAARLAREGGSHQLGDGALAAKTAGQLESTRSAFEKTFSLDGIVTFDWYRKGEARARAVGRVEDPVRKPFGTGFLLPASLVIAGATAGAQIFVTNAHVVSASVSGALPPGLAYVCFEAWKADEIFQVGELLWESPPDQLDAAIIRLDRPVDVAPLDLCMPAPEPAYVERQRQRFYAIGYPKGGRLSMSIDDNLQVGWKRPLLHYRTPTEPGSSGSPIFDRYWQLVALHHSGKSDMARLDGKPGTYEANEGIWIHDIVASARQALATARP